MTHQPHTPRPRFRRPLLALNAALLCACLAVTLAPTAGAQNQTTRARGEYTMVGGEVNGSSSNAITVLDAANREMVTLLWDSSRRRLQGVGYRDLITDLVAENQR